MVCRLRWSNSHTLTQYYNNSGQKPSWLPRYYVYAYARAARECVYKAGWLVGSLLMPLEPTAGPPWCRTTHTNTHTIWMELLTRPAPAQRVRCEREHHTFGIFGIWDPLVKLAPTASERTPKLNFPKSQFSRKSFEGANTKLREYPFFLPS